MPDNSRTTTSRSIRARSHLAAAPSELFDEEPSAQDIASVEPLALWARDASEVELELKAADAAAQSIEAERAARALIEQPWQLDAACAGQTELMDQPWQGSRIDEALALCASCPVLTQCRQWATRENAEHYYFTGVAGGRVWRRGTAEDEDLHDAAHRHQGAA